jgi:hypothetical protein
MTWAGYILGFPNDTPESIASDIDIIKRELPIDILEFFVLTPLPGSEDHKHMLAKGVPMDPDLNNYDLEHMTTHHLAIPAEAWDQVYRDAWRRYYTDEHVETVLRRAVRDGLNPRKLADVLTAFRGGFQIEGVHPLQVGVFRRKIRRDRRPGLPRENPLVFYPRRVGEAAWSIGAWASLWLRHHRVKRRVMADPTAKLYQDEALRPVTEETALPEFVRAYADRIPRTHGAPTVRAVAS